MEEIPLFAISAALKILWHGELRECLEDPSTVVRKLYPKLYLVCTDAEAERIGAILIRRVGELERPP